MKIILDTNVFISGVFSTGPPYQILKAWRDGKVQLVISQEMLDEYQRVGETLPQQFPGLDLGPILELLTIKAELISAPGLSVPVCDDPDDDTFLAYALASKAKLIVSGDKHLLRVSGYRGIVIVSPRKCIDEYLIEEL